MAAGDGWAGTAGDIPGICCCLGITGSGWTSSILGAIFKDRLSDSKDF